MNVPESSFTPVSPCSRSEVHALLKQEPEDEPMSAAETQQQQEEEELGPIVLSGAAILALLIYLL
jgi:hypothetical protein